MSCYDALLVLCTQGALRSLAWLAAALSCCCAGHAPFSCFGMHLLCGGGRGGGGTLARTWIILLLSGVLLFVCLVILRVCVSVCVAKPPREAPAVLCCRQFFFWGRRRRMRIEGWRCDVDMRHITACSKKTATLLMGLAAVRRCLGTSNNSTLCACHCACLLVYVPVCVGAPRHCIILGSTRTCRALLTASGQCCSHVWVAVRLSAMFVKAARPL